MSLRYTAGSGDTVVELRSRSATRTLLARVTLTGTSDFTAFATVTTELSGTTPGLLFISFPGPRALDSDTVSLSS